MHKVTIKPLAGKLESHFSFAFQGTVWNMVMVPGKPILLLEIRNEERRQVSFSAVDFQANRFLWRDVTAIESWWINLHAVRENLVILKKFESTDNPDSVSYVNLDLQTGATLGTNKADVPDFKEQEILVPVQYHQGTAYFETVKNFIEKKMNITPVHVIEYLEDSGLIFSSVYVKSGIDLENHLLVFADRGDVLLREKLGEGLKGLGLVTFFLNSGYLFYVKNKIELVTYRVLPN